MAQFASKEAIANTPRSPRSDNIIPQPPEKVNILEEKTCIPPTAEPRQVNSRNEKNILLDTSIIKDHDNPNRTFMHYFYNVCTIDGK